MAIEKIEKLLEQIQELTPAEKGQLFSLFLVKEKEQMKGSRKDLFGSVKMDKEISDEDIESCLYNPNLDDLLKWIFCRDYSCWY